MGRVRSFLAASEHGNLESEQNGPDGCWPRSSLDPIRACAHIVRLGLLVLLEAAGSVELAEAGIVAFTGLCGLCTVLVVDR